ncbi:MAG TPA: hypothetical protein VHE13_16575 [Opitutus sp.]|nr:hypothetical protein [Opitutus sp.]
MRSFPALATLTTVALLALPSAHACSVCGCSLSSDWAAQGYPMMPGFQVGVRYEYFDQTDLRAGTRSVDRAAIAFPADDEIQQRTLNRNTWLDLDYVVNRRWGLAVQVPYHDRLHTTIDEGETEVSTSDASGLGDVRVLARWQQFTLSRSVGLQFGLKLPTGRIDQQFASGPTAGEEVDRGLQLGTGTTDLLLGASWFSRPTPHLGTFAQLSLSQPLAARDGFRPATSATLSGGVRWLNATHFTPQLQLNVRWDGREHGAEADTPNSGGTFAFVSPGLTAELGANATGFVFVQLPVFQRVNGLQLEPRSLLTLGVRVKL